MDFGKTLFKISSFLDEKGERYALIGGVALVAYGFFRTTLDLDLVVDLSNRDTIIRYMESQEYKTLESSSGYSSHSHPDPSWGRVDFLYVHGETAQKLFDSCRPGKAPGGIEVLLPKPEHLAAMKVIAMKNNPSRVFQDLADIRLLLTLPGVDRIEIEDYFDRHGMAEKFDELEKSL